MRSRTRRNFALFAGLLVVLTLRLYAGTLPARDIPPDVILHPSPFTIHSGAQTHRFEISSGQAKDRWIRGFQLQSCDPKQIESANIYVDKTGQWLGTWTPGENVISFPDTVAAWLPSSAKLVVEVHYAPVTTDTEDCSSIGLFFTDKRPLRPLMQMGIQTPVAIPGGTGVELRKEFTVITDSYAFALQPEMRAAGRSVEVTAVDPSGSSQLLYGEKNFNASENAPRIFGQPLFIAKGSRIIATASYRNPDPETNADDVFKLNLSLYPRSEVHPPIYDGAAAKPAPVRHSAVAAKKASTTKKATSKKSPAKKHSL
jgi:hypothetical protein